MKSWVVGFAFSADKKHIAVIEKTHPEDQAGLFNGIGGNRDPLDQYPVDSMVREFEEETGVVTTPGQWDFFLDLREHGQLHQVVRSGGIKAGLKRNDSVYMEGKNLYVFRMFSDKIFDCVTMEKEKVHVLPVSEAMGKPMLQNTVVLMALCLCDFFIEGKIKVKF